ncbi:MAG: hypothetical protein KAI95_05550 [Bacteroidales bacterium]|nr:hypothetical protein [Bacteroidales bacterium]
MLYTEEWRNMVFRNFRIQIIIRILILLASLAACSWSFADAQYLRAVYLGILVMLLLIEFFYYVDRMNKDINQFISSIFHEDYTSVFNARSKGRSFRLLYETMNDITLKYKTLSKEKETRGQYLYSLIEQVRVGIISYEPSGRVHLVNRAFTEMLAKPALQPGTDLSRQEPELLSILNNTPLGKRQLVPLKIHGEEKEFSLLASGFRMENTDFNLVSVQNIREELEERELEAWQKLIRVLTHEIMNSITPIASLSSTLEIMLKGITDGGNVREDMDIDAVMEIQQALQTINKRSTGLLHFVNTYRNLTRIPKPNFKIFPVQELFKNLYLLMEEEITENKINFVTNIEPENIEVSADEQLVEQVIINLIRNSLHALDGRKDPTIELKTYYNKRGRVTIQVADNGTGILPEVLDKIFIPFFTTKQSGSGIGLSLSRQILRLHNGTITAHSVPDEETIFTLTF